MIENYFTAKRDFIRTVCKTCKKFALCELRTNAIIRNCPIIDNWKTTTNKPKIIS